MTDQQMTYEVWTNGTDRQRTFRDFAQAATFANEARRAYLTVEILERDGNGRVVQTYQAERK